MSTLGELWNDINEAKTWREKIWTFIAGKDVTLDEFLDTLSGTLMGIPVVGVIGKAIPRVSASATKAVGEFLAKEGSTALPALTKSVGLIKTPIMSTALKVVAPITKAITRFVPYTISEIVGEISGKASYTLAKKGITDLVSNVLAPSFRWLSDIKIALNEYVLANTNAFVRFKIWQSAIISWQKAFVGENFLKVYGLIKGVQVQIDTVILIRLAKLEVDVKLIKADIPIKIAALENKMSLTLINSITKLTALISKNTASNMLLKLETDGKFLAVNNELALSKAATAKNSLQLMGQDAIIKELPTSTAKYTDTKIQKTWEENLPVESDKELDAGINELILMGGWIPKKIADIYGPLMPKIIFALGKGYKMYG